MQKILPAGKYLICDPVPLLEKIGVDIDYFFKINNQFIENDEYYYKNQSFCLKGCLITDFVVLQCKFGLKPKILKDNFGFKYKNSNGVIGLLPYRIVEEYLEFTDGRVLEFKSEFSVSVFDGVLTFSNIKIDTNGS